MANDDNGETLDSKFNDILDEMLDVYDTETVLFRLQKRLDGRMQTHGIGNGLIFTEIEAIKEALNKIGDAHYKLGE